MKFARFLAVRFMAGVLSLAAPAHAGPTGTDLAAEASRLMTQVNAVRAEALAHPAARAKPLPQPLVADLERFGLSASRLSVEIDKAGGPVDLRCIFRGMAEETDTQLKAAAAAPNGSAQARPLDRLASMLRDANEIAPAAALASSASRTGKPMTASCPAVRP